MSQNPKLTLAEALREKANRLKFNKLKNYAPYPKQLEFHNAGSVHRERLYLAANRCGKTESGAAEMSMHLTGRYPDWWRGRRFSNPIKAWAAGITSESTRDVVQDKLLGPYASREEWGSGYIPKDCIIDVSQARSIFNAVDSVVIKHISGGQSYLGFKSYEKGREKWQGTALDVGWL